MIEQIKYELILTAFFLLVFILAVLLLEPYKDRINAFLKKKSRFLMKFPWDTVSKGFALGVFILFLKKLIYYMPVPGMIQTKFSVWWVNEKTLIILYIILVLQLVVILLIGIKKGFIQSKSIEKKFEAYKKKPNISPFLLLFVLVIIFFKLNLEYPITLWHLLALLILAPLVVLKMVCTGKYLGLLTSFVLGVFVIDRYKKIKPVITGSKAKFLLAPGLILAGFIVFSFFYFPGNWEKRISHRLETAKSERAVMDLLDAAPTIHHERVRHKALQQILLTIKKEDIQWSKKIYQKMIKGTQTIGIVYFKANLLQDVAVMILESGNIRWAVDTAHTIEVAQVKFDTFIKIFKAISTLEKQKWAKEILQQAMDKVSLIRPWQHKSEAFKEIALAAVEAGEVDWAKTIYQKAVGAAKMIKSREVKCKTIKKLALEILKTGDTAWAKAVAAMIPNFKIRNSVLTKIREKIRKK
ncbi:MAG: hypothetical protein JSV88_25660 [Candidatus Aminicenantes bacterium]|nr:MAG: hypothetical protein JSV88_25660 [Candidatus Aminicenantes bacterium]